MFDIALRDNLSGCSVKELTTKLRQLPPHAIVCCCGADTMYLHIEQDGSAVCLDVEDLEDSYPDTCTMDTVIKQDKKVYTGALFGKVHALLDRWENRLRERYANLCRRIARNWNKDHATYREFVLAAQLQQAKDDVKFLQGELETARKSDTDRQRKFQGLREVFAEILEKPNDQLRQDTHFDVQESEDGSGWEVVTAHCSLGGCDLDIYSFVQEREALLFAGLLTAIDYKPPHYMACPTCYAEYKQGCV